MRAEAPARGRGGAPPAPRWAPSSRRARGAARDAPPPAAQPPASPLLPRPRARLRLGPPARPHAQALQARASRRSRSHGEMEAGACVAPSPLLWCTCSLLGLQAVLVRQYESSRGDLTVSMRLDENAG